MDMETVHTTPWAKIAKIKRMGYCWSNKQATVGRLFPMAVVTMKRELTPKISIHPVILKPYEILSSVGNRNVSVFLFI